MWKLNRTTALNFLVYLRNQTYFILVLEVLSVFVFPDLVSSKCLFSDLSHQIPECLAPACEKPDLQFAADLTVFCVIFIYCESGLWDLNHPTIGKVRWYSV